MKDFYGNDLRFFEQRTGNVTFTKEWVGVRSQSITVPKGRYAVTFKYSVLFNEGTYFARIFSGNNEIGSETKVANIYYNLKGTLTAIVAVNESTNLHGEIGSGQSSVIGKKCDYVLTIAKIA